MSTERDSSFLLGYATNLFTIALSLLETSHFSGLLVNLVSNLVMNLLTFLL